MGRTKGICGICEKKILSGETYAVRTERQVPAMASGVKGFTPIHTTCLERAQNQGLGEVMDNVLTWFKGAWRALS
jgi:hypothetical protein